MTIAIYVYNGMTMLDAIGPYEILRNVKGADIKFVAKEKGEITADSHFVSINAKFGINPKNGNGMYGFDHFGSNRTAEGQESYFSLETDQYAF